MWIIITKKKRSKKEKKRMKEKSKKKSKGIKEKIKMKAKKRKQTTSKTGWEEQSNSEGEKRELLAFLNCITKFIKCEVESLDEW